MEVRVKPKGKKNTSPIQQFDRISKGSNRVLSTVMGLITLLSVIPFILVCIISVSDSDSITKYGYSLIPRKFSWSAYQYVFSDGGILKAFGTSVFITVMGTVIGLLLMSTYAYALSRKSFAYQKILARIALFPMLFGGGMIGNYLVVVNILKLRNSVWALILPMAMSTFSIMVLRTFYRMTIPD
jgi:putative aldouronate transport system permease protein